MLGSLKDVGPNWWVLRIPFSSNHGLLRKRGLGSGEEKRKTGTRVSPKLI